jgi:hypothetical protein
MSTTPTSRGLVAALLAAALAACLLATHNSNSYWVDRGVTSDTLASGARQRLADQLLVDRSRAIELDIHPAAERGEYRVFHTQRG